jgi:hypothetical protein
MVGKAVFQIVAVASLITGLVELYFGFGSIVFILLGIFSLVYALAWAQIAAMCDVVGYLEHEVDRLKEELKL